MTPLFYLQQHANLTEEMNPYQFICCLVLQTLQMYLCLLLLAKVLVCISWQWTELTNDVIVQPFA